MLSQGSLREKPGHSHANPKQKGGGARRALLAEDWRRGTFRETLVDDGPYSQRGSPKTPAKAGLVRLGIQGKKAEGP